MARHQDAVHIAQRRQYLQGRVVALAEQLQGADGDDALRIVDQLLGTAHELLEIVRGHYE